MKQKSEKLLTDISQSGDEIVKKENGIQNLRREMEANVKRKTRSLCTAEKHGEAEKEEAVPEVIRRFLKKGIIFLKKRHFWTRNASACAVRQKKSKNSRESQYCLYVGGI